MRDAVLGHLARTQRLGHRLGRHAEQVGLQVGPQPLRLVVGGHAHDGEVVAGEHPRAHGHVRGRDVRAHHGQRAHGAHVLREGGEHHARPHGAAAPQKTPREGVAPREVVDGTRGAREHGRRLVAVEPDAPEVQDVEHLHVQVGGHLHAGAQGRVGRVAQQLECLGHGVRGAAVPRPHRGVHHHDGGAGGLRRGPPRNRRPPRRARPRRRQLQTGRRTRPRRPRRRAPGRGAQAGPRHPPPFPRRPQARPRPQRGRRQRPLPQRQGQKACGIGAARPLRLGSCPSS